MRSEFATTPYAGADIQATAPADSPTPATLRPASRTANVSSSAVREILKITQRPDVISLAGGLPAPDSFPVHALRSAFDAVLDEDGTGALQYSTTEGEAGLRAWVADQETARGIPTEPDEVLITASSQQALDLVAKALVEPGAPVLVESPTYLGAVQAFSVFEPVARELPTDEDGVRPDALDADLARDARFLYLMPNFQNPTGRTLTAERRAALAEAARRHDLWLVEDDPYGELWYESAPPPSLRAWAPERTIRICSFSKVLAPGLRLGFVVAPRDATDLLVRLKQAADLHTSTVIQRAALHALSSGLMASHLPEVRAIYARQCRAMLDALATSMPPSVTWTRPAGGMFVWATLPEAIDTTALLAKAVERRVAFVPGEAFYAARPRRNTMRLSFATVSSERIREAVAILGELVREAGA
jgi:2-aminoadipate transaminase